MSQCGATSFSRNVISSNRRFAETSCRRMSFYQIGIWPNVIFPTHHLVENYFPNRQSRQNDVGANDVSGKRRSAEQRFVKMIFGWTIIRENDVWLNNDSEKCRSALWSFANSTIWPCDDSVKWLSAIFFRQNNDSAKLHFRKTTIRWNDVSGRSWGPSQCDYDVPKIVEIG